MGYYDQKREWRRSKAKPVGDAEGTENEVRADVGGDVSDVLSD